ncbi:hypothetical protein GYMLUDRAFT_64916 [Collybiopsis luxurians FD-317 M1]|uniref:Uncharacterized protein n=1 Tax=Collybiopsis luxurians FD-317 M1 TaxID=944289 RepID=A0A0D0BAG3_9AGAR|nr:hypothetical protein GYMLUDRAFT_64916 [Collybiopsis luxurians FD-317 M1]
MKFFDNEGTQVARLCSRPPPMTWNDYDHESGKEGNYEDEDAGKDKCSDNGYLSLGTGMENRLGPVQNDRVSDRHLGRYNTRTASVNSSPTEGDLPTMNSTCSYTDTPKESQVYHEQYSLHEKFLSSLSPSLPARRAWQLHPSTFCRTQTSQKPPGHSEFMFRELFWRPGFLAHTFGYSCMRVRASRTDVHRVLPCYLGIHAAMSSSKQAGYWAIGSQDSSWPILQYLLSSFDRQDHVHVHVQYVQIHILFLHNQMSYTKDTKP